MRKIKLILSGLTFLLFFINLQYSFAIDGAGVFGGGPIYNEGTTTINELRQSGFKWVCVWTIHVLADGDLNFNGDFLIVDDGSYKGTVNRPDFASNMALLKTAPTSVEWIEFGLSGYGSTSFANIRQLIATEGTGPGSTLYENFKALRDAVPSIDAFSFDDENEYHEPSTTQFAIMLADLGFKVSICPYTNPTHWQNVVANTNAARPGTIEDVQVQAYAGGINNNPCTWDSYFAPEINVMPGVESSSDIAGKMANWNNSCGITGGWLWIYDFFWGNLSTVQSKAADINNNISGGGTNLALNKPTVSSSVYSSSYLASNAVDGNASSTRWASASGSANQWIYVDLQQTYPIDRVVVKWQGAYGKNYTIDVWNGSSWQTIKTVTNNSSLTNNLTVSTTGRYIRLNATAYGPYTLYSIYEFEVYGAPVSAETNLALNRPIVTSSTYSSSYPASKAVDGNASSTRWASASGSANQWIWIDLQSTYSVSKVVVKWQAAYAKNYTIDVWNGSSWQAIRTITNNSSLTNNLTVSTTGRYFRMNATAHGPYTLYSIYEFEIFGNTNNSAKNSLTKKKPPTDIKPPIEQTEIKIYPNPVRDVFTVEYPGINAEITISDILGRQVYKNTFIDKIKISTDEILGKGLMIIKLANETNTYIEKIVVK